MGVGAGQADLVGDAGHQVSVRRILGVVGDLGQLLAEFDLVVVAQMHQVRTDLFGRPSCCRAVNLILAAQLKQQKRVDYGKDEGAGLHDGTVCTQPAMIAAPDPPIRKIKTR